VPRLLDDVRDSDVDFADAAPGFWTSAATVAGEVGTPFFIYLPKAAERAYQRFAEGAQAWGTATVAYSVKTNPLPILLTDLCHQGAFAEAVSEWEFRQSLAAGFPPEHIVFNGPLKTEQALRFAIQRGALAINIDSVDELDRIEQVMAGEARPANVGVRLCPPQVDGAWSRFGLQIPTGEADEAIARVQSSPSLVLSCVQCHLGTQTGDVSRYVEVVRLARELWTRHALGGDVWLDIGGGFPFDHSLPADDQPFSPSAFFGTLASAWGDSSRPRLLTEPGRILAAPALAIVARVLSRKPRLGEPTIVVLDSGTNHNVMAAFFEHVWSYRTEDALMQGDHRLCGPLCMEDDLLSGARQGRLPKLGSLVATFNAGAYSLALARPFIQAVPPVVTFNEDRSYGVVLAGNHASRETEEGQQVSQ
jgi:diaminopimelate decarboxylase